MKVWYFSAPWCVPCKVMLPLAQAVCEKAKIPFTVHDIGEEKNIAIASYMHVQSVPTVIIFDDADKECFRFAGTFDIASLKKVLKVTADE